MNPADILLWLGSAAVMVGVLVIIHELGHFVVARLFGVGTPVFSVGVGPRIFGFRFWETDFRISLLPIGGYVRMAGADPFGDEDPDDIVDPDEDFMRKPVWQRLLVMLAGPAANLALPFVLYTGVLMLGEPQLDTSVGTIIPGTPAEQIGLRVDDRIVEIAGVPVDNWTDFLRVLDDQEGAAVPIGVVRDGSPLALTFPQGSVEFTIDGRVDTERMGFFQSRLAPRIGVSDPTSPAWVAGLRPGDKIEQVDGQPVETWVQLRRALSPGAPHDLVVSRPATEVVGAEVERREVTLRPDPTWTPAADEVQPDPWGIVHASLFVGYVLPGSAADEAGVRAGDRLVAIDGTHIRSWSDVLGLVRRTVEDIGPEAEARSLLLTLARDGAPVELEFRPRVEREVVMGNVNYRPIMGVTQFGSIWVAGPETRKYYSLFEAVPRAVDEAGMVLKSTLTVLGNLLSGDLKPKESIGGPIEIARTAAQAAEEGIFMFVRVMGMISFSLGVINLLPVPVLDGGQIVFYAIEGIRGRPLPLVLRERIQMVGVLFLAALMVMVFVMDVSRWLES